MPINDKERQGMTSRFGRASFYLDDDSQGRVGKKKKI